MMPLVNGTKLTKRNYTSKTCTRCGYIHQKLSGAKTFSCPECGHTLPRDINGTLGIMLKALSDTTYAISNDGVAIVAPLVANLTGRYLR